MTPRDGVRDDVHLGHEVGAGRILADADNTSRTSTDRRSRKPLPGALFQASRWEVRRDRLGAILPVILTAALVVAYAAVIAIPSGAP